MSRWFRFYDDVVNDPKVQKLPGELFKDWVNILCLASHSDGQISVDDIAFLLRKSAKESREIIEKLITCGLLDRVDTTMVEPHNWAARQYKSDVSTSRVKRFRKRVQAVSETADETAPEQSRTEADTEQKIDDGDAGASECAFEHPKQSPITPDAWAVAERIGKRAGYHTPQDWPIGWNGFPYRIQTFLNEGYPPETIAVACEGVLAKKRDGPP